MSDEIAQPAFYRASGAPAARTPSLRGIPPVPGLVTPPRVAGTVPLDEWGIELVISVRRGVELVLDAGERGGGTGWHWGRRGGRGGGGGRGGSV